MGKIILRTKRKYVLTQYILLSLVVYLSSFRGSVSDDFPDYNVPALIGIMQNFSVITIMIVMFTSICIEVFNRRISSIRSNDKIYYYYIFQLFTSLPLLTIDNNVNNFLQKILFISVILAYCCIVIRKMEFFSTERVSIIKSIFWGLSLFIITNLVIHAFSLGNMSWKGRLYGLTAHPNFMGMCSSISVVVSCSLFYFTKKNTWRTVYILATFAALWVCLLSGSRNGLASSVVGIFAFFLFLIKKGNIKFIIMLFSIIVILTLISIDFSVNSLDYESRGNTREETWNSLYEQALEFPLFGNGKNKSATTNAYLFSIVASGVFGAFFFYAALLKLIRVFRLRVTKLNIHKLAIYKSLLIVILFSSMFEGYLLDAISVPVFVFWILLSDTFESSILRKIKPNQISHSRTNDLEKIYLS